MSNMRKDNLEMMQQELEHVLPQAIPVLREAIQHMDNAYRNEADASLERQRAYDRLNKVHDILSIQFGVPLECNPETDNVTIFPAL